MAYKITDIEGIGPALAEKFYAAGIKTVEALLKKAADKKGRTALAEATGIDEKKLLSFVNAADLFRIKGISAQYSDLLHAAGVDSVPELAQRKPENLHAKLEEVNAEHKRVRQLPALKSVEDWVAQAKSLPKVITH